MYWVDRVRAAFVEVTPPPGDDVIEELAQHANQMYESTLAQGCSPEDAERRVAGQLEAWRLEAPALRRRSRRPAPIVPPVALASSSFTGLMQDVRYAARLVRRQPRHALLTILTIALGIGATTVLFSVTYGVLAKPLPWPNAERLVTLKETRGGSVPRFGDFTNAAYLAWHEQPATIEAIAAWSQRLVTLTGIDAPERIRITAATASLFQVLGARPLIGSLFDQNDEKTHAIVLSEWLWRKRFGADPAVLGTTVLLDGEAYAVKGVLPDQLMFPDRQACAIVPYSVHPTAGNYLSMFSAIAALSPGATAAQAAAEGTARGRVAADTGMTTQAIFGGNGPIEITALPLRDALTADVRRPLIVLLAAVVLLLATATANVACLQLARDVSRSREMAIRAALGAGAARVTRQLLAEGLLLGLIGGAVGLAFTLQLHRWMPSLLPADFPRADDLGIDTVVATFTLVVSAGTGMILGLLPASRVRRLNLVVELSEQGKISTGASLRTPATRARLLILSAQVAISCVLLVGASLLGRSFLALLNADRGFDPAGVVSARLSMPSAMYPAPERRFAMVDQILARLAAIPGVTEAAFTSELPLTPGGSATAFDLRSPKAEGGIVKVQASPRIVSPRYFSVLRSRMIAGRGFTDDDSESSEPVVVVNETFARRYLGDPALGSRLPASGDSPEGEERVEWTVIGVVSDVRYVTAGGGSQPELYYSHRQMKGKLPVQTVTLLARTSGDPEAVATALRTVAREPDERLVADVVMPLEQRLLMTLARPRLYAMLLGGFAAFALAIAAVGQFGLLSYSVSQRSREMAIRAALGARKADILRLILRQGLGVTFAGLAAGMMASFWLTRLLSAQLYGVTSHDPLTFILVPAVLLAVGALACLVPARRAANLEPMALLREG